MYTLQQSTATRSLKILYIGTVTVVTALTLAGKVITQRSLHNQSDDSHIVNIAGQQRMLSQQTAHSLRDTNDALGQLKEAAQYLQATSVG